MGNGGRGGKTVASSLVSSFLRFSSSPLSGLSEIKLSPDSSGLSAVLSRLLKNSLDCS